MRGGEAAALDSGLVTTARGRHLAQPPTPSLPAWEGAGRLTPMPHWHRPRPQAVHGARVLLFVLLSLLVHTDPDKLHRTLGKAPAPEQMGRPEARRLKAQVSVPYTMCPLQAMHGAPRGRCLPGRAVHTLPPLLRPVPSDGHCSQMASQTGGWSSLQQGQCCPHQAGSSLKVGARFPSSKDGDLEGLVRK